MWHMLIFYIPNQNCPAQCFSSCILFKNDNLRAEIKSVKNNQKFLTTVCIKHTIHSSSSFFCAPFIYSNLFRYAWNNLAGNGFHFSKRKKTFVKDLQLSSPDKCSCLFFPTREPDLYTRTSLVVKIWALKLVKNN